MGCDIHLYKEKFVEGKWVTADEWEAYDFGDDDKGIEVPWKKRFTERNYQLFGLLSKGVRSVHPFSFEPRGLPFDPCAEIAQEAERWGEDGHSHSYLFLHELNAMLRYVEAKTIPISGMKDKEGLEALNASIASGSPNWDLLWPYCQWTSSDQYVEFNVDVPASLYFGESLQKIIDGFEGMDGENHRIVFFFDN
ncbi:hypothetical protein [Caballeronia telluris]|uniref:Uncharacterized protein n=1 Tax=Caballeronia telluris TaxID=326475 RepID=A0A158G3B9_9BURK|nr:hypothetical protein [Caballeronia telluris]SAL26129.1 hypothetical protein AWB66_01513 [Caballeronia telluris]